MVMRISPVPFFWAEVQFSMLGDLGKSIDVSFKAKFKRLEQEEYEKLLARVNAARRAAILGEGSEGLIAVAQEGQPADAETGSAKPLTDLEVINQVLLDWGEMLGDDDQPLPFTPDNLTLALRTLGCKAAIVKRFFELHGQELEKNFAPRPATTSGV